jgi:predicted restriction endonuclease
MKRDLFRVMGELGDGHWGLRQYVTPQTSETDIDRFSDDVAPGLPPEKQIVIREIIKRDQRLAKALKKARDYTCEVCGAKSTWVTSEGVPYVEAHHVIALGEDGFDDERNLIIACADCHRMLHYGANAKGKSRELRIARGLPAQ